MAEIFHDQLDLVKEFLEEEMIDCLKSKKPLREIYSKFEDFWNEKRAIDEAFYIGEYIFGERIFSRGLTELGLEKCYVGGLTHFAGKRFRGDSEPKREMKRIKSNNKFYVDKFCEECLEALPFDSPKRIVSSKVYFAYYVWCYLNQYKPIDRNRFSKGMRESGIEKRFSSGSIFWAKISFSQEWANKIFTQENIDKYARAAME